MGRNARINIPNEVVRRFCEKYHIRRLSLFGSVLREDFASTSDVDVLVEFQPAQRVGLLKIARMENELSGLLGRRVDLRTPQDLSRYFRREVLRDAEVQYAEG